MAEPIRLLHLSDLHFSLPVPLGMIETAITTGLNENPDIICVTGDFITRWGNLDFASYARTLSRLPVAAPTYAVLGNHDGGRWAARWGGDADNIGVRKLLHDAGIQLLHNTSTRVEVRSARVTLAGAGDLWSDQVDADRAFAGVDDAEAVILLAHNPDTKDLVADRTWDLMLSGHTHGGQVRIPFEGARFAPVVDKRYVRGLRAWGAKQIHVSAGVGNVGGVRFRCRPEVNLLTIGC